jgi:hypothetical protein
MLKYTLLTLILVAAFTPPGHTEVIERIEAVVNEKAITKSDLDEEMAIRRQLGEGVERKRVLDSIIEWELVSKEAGRLGITVSVEEVTGEMLRFEGTFPSKDEFKSFLDSYELNVKDLSRRFAASIAVEKVRRQKEGISPGRYEKWLSDIMRRSDIRIIGE